jgi:hypothetical protein
MSTQRITLVQHFNPNYNPLEMDEHDKHVWQVESTNNYLEYSINQQLSHFQVQTLIDNDTLEVKIK